MEKPFLPHGLRILVEAAGREAALAIWMEYAGSRLYVPAGKSRRVTVLQKLVGDEAAQKITAALGGEVVQVPLAKKVVNGWLRELGWGASRRARALKAARRTVTYWDNDNATTRPQGTFADD